MRAQAHWKTQKERSEVKRSENIWFRTHLMQEPPLESIIILTTIHEETICSQRHNYLHCRNIEDTTRSNRRLSMCLSTHGQSNYKTLIKRQSTYGRFPARDNWGQKCAAQTIQYPQCTMKSSCIFAQASLSRAASFQSTKH